MSTTRKPKSKKEEALAFLDDLDNLAGPGPESAPPAASAGAGKEGSASSKDAGAATGTGLATPRASSTIDRPKSDTGRASGELVRASPRKAGVGGGGRPGTPSSASAAGETEDPNEALAFLEAQLATKRPARVSTPTPGSTAVHTARGEATGPVLSAPTTSRSGTPVNVPSTTTSPAPAQGGGWSFWSSASAAVAKAREVADEGYKRVREQAEVARESAQAQAQAVAERAGAGEGGVRGLAEGLGQLGQLGKGVVKGVDLERLRHDILTRGQSAITELINTVAPPISEHEVLQVWLAHEMVGYDGVTSVVEAGVARIMEQTSSEDLEVIFLPPAKPPAEGTAGDKAAQVDAGAATEAPPSTTSPRVSLDPGALLASAQALASQFAGTPFTPDGERSLGAVRGWDEGWRNSKAGVEGLVERARADARRKQPDPSLPITTIPLYMHIQPVLVPLPFPEPPISTARRDSVGAADASPSRSLNPPASASAAGASAEAPAPHHLTFILGLVDSTHSLRFTTVTQYCPEDWLEVEYDRSDWVEERLVGVLRTGVEGLLQEYVATRMGLKRSTYQPDSTGPFTPSSTNRSSGEGAAPSETAVAAQVGVSVETESG